jgi:uncharacterized membrane protein (DUF4010 family)
MSPWPLFQQLALALGLAFFFGVAFEDYYARIQEPRPGGVRTFPMLTLVGSLLYMLDTTRLLPLTAGFLGISAWLAIYYYRRTAERDEKGVTPFGLMIPVCNITAFLLGPTAMVAPLWVPCGVTATAVLFLTSRDRLHSFAREIEISELVTAGKFLVLSGLVLPLLPDYPVLGLTSVTPRQAWLALIAISTISYVSYLLQHYVKPKRASALVAVLGGLYSSTATTIALARQARLNADLVADAQSGVFIATALMYVRVLVVVAIFNQVLAKHLAPLLLPLTVLAFLLSFASRSRTRPRTPDANAPSPPPANPLALSTAGIFAVFFVATSVMTTFVQDTFGFRGLYGLAGLIGFTEIDPFVLNLATGGNATLSPHVAAAAILIAVSSNNILKALCALFIGGVSFGLLPGAGLALLALGGLASAAWLA